MTRRALVVCTANVCRSPTVERLFRRRLEGVRDVDGETWTVTSAGTRRVDARTDINTVRAAASVGIDLNGHLPRVLDREILTTDGADLVLVMTREHVRDVVVLDRDAWSRTFTLKELVRRAQGVEPPSAADGSPAGSAAWVRAAAPPT